MAQDGLWLLFLRRGRAFVPTMAKTAAGFYMGVEPVEVVDAADQAAVADALIRAVNRGNPVVPTPTRDNYPEDPLLKHAGVKSLATFEKSAQSWKLSKREGAYLIAPYRPSGEGGAEEDLERTEAVPAREPLESVVHRLVERAAHAAQVAKR